MMKTLKKIVKSIPIIGSLLHLAYIRILGTESLVFEHSAQYWEDRYRLGRTSGSGSYGRLAQFKAEFLNNFIKEQEISTIVEFGCGDGAQLELADYPSYIGFDVAPTSINLCQEKFAGRPEYNFYLVGSTEYENLQPVDLALSLDVIYHLVEDDVFETYMRKLFSSARRYIIIYAYDFDRTYASRHERGRNFTKWIMQNAPEWKMTSRVPNRYPYDPLNPNNTSQSDFFIFEPRNRS